jgi:hypothetical protein
MNWNRFKSDYPTMANLLPQNFMSDADSENTLRRAIEQDRTSYLGILEQLATATPAKKIRKDAKRLNSKTTFQGVLRGDAGLRRTTKLGIRPTTC